MRYLTLLLSVLVILFMVSGQAQATLIPLTLTLSPDSDADYDVLRADLTGLSISQIAWIKLTDDNDPFAPAPNGSPGIFSGFDLDAIFLDADGLLATAGDRSFAASFVFTAGSTRFTLDPIMQPNGAHPGPTFGSIDATTIDHATATLNTLDGVASADVNIADGFLSFGDGGMLTANFSPEVGIGGSLFLITSEVGKHEGLSSVTVSDEPVPEPGTFLLLGTGLAGLAGYSKLRSRRRKRI